MIAGCAAGSALLMRTWPRLVGCRLHTDGVIASNACSGEPNLSSDNGCTCHSMLADACARIALGERAELRRRHRQAGRSAERVLERHRGSAEPGARAPIQRDACCAPYKWSGSADGRAGSRRRRADRAMTPMPCWRSSAAGPTTRELQDLRRADRARREQHLAPRAQRLPARVREPHDDARRALRAVARLERDALDERVGTHREIRPLQHRPQERLGRAPAHAAPLVHLKIGVAEIVAAIELRDLRDAAFLGRVAPRVEDLPAHAPLLDAQLAAARRGTRRRRARSPRSA